MPSHITLYRPATPAQLDAIAGRGWHGFGDESLVAGHFYPMLYRDYARLVARGWNRRQYGEGFVLGFAVDADWISQFQPQTVATARHLEYRIPAAIVPELNRYLRGRIRLLERHGTTRPLAAPAHRDGDWAWAV